MAATRLFALSTLLCVSGLFAQTKPSFEAASIKAVPDSVGWPPRAGYWVQPQMENPRRLRALTLLSQIIEWAYDVRDFQLEGGPAWLKQGRFEIQATADHPVTQAEMREMLQTLLLDRLNLKVHREHKELPVYALVVGKNGPRLTPTENASQYRGVGNFDVGKGIVMGHGATMAGFCQILTDNLERPVIDKTGLDGRYDFRISAEPESSGDGFHPIGAGIFTPIQDLGLRLEPQKDQIEMLVIDSADRPSDN